jgi:hypothetical protein
METSTILLIVAVVILIYVIFFVMTGTQTIMKKTDLAVAQTPMTAAELVSPEASTYSYSMWIYVYGPKEQIGANKYIISRTAAGDATKKNIGLKIDSTKPSLILEYTSTAASTTTQKSLQISDDFPLQTWVHLIVSVQGQYIDCYMNGKLIKSIKDAVDTPSGSTDLEYGRFPAYLAKLERTTKATDPQTAWDEYTKGNGENPLKKYMANLGLDIVFSKDGKDNYKLTVL